MLSVSEKKKNSGFAVSTISFIIIAVTGTIFLIKIKSSIWMYLLLYLIVAPILSGVIATAYLSVTGGIEDIPEKPQESKYDVVPKTSMTGSGANEIIGTDGTKIEVESLS